LKLVFGEAASRINLRVAYLYLSLRTKEFPISRKTGSKRPKRPRMSVSPPGLMFYERGESRKNFSHAGGMKDSFGRQPPLPVSPPTRL
jgi:hypothetical protein